MMFLIIIFCSVAQTLCQPYVNKPCDELSSEIIRPIQEWIQTNLSATLDWMDFSSTVDSTFNVCYFKKQYFERCHEEHPQNVTLLNSWNQTLEDYCYFFNQLYCYENYTGWKCVDESLNETVSPIVTELFLEYMRFLKTQRGASHWKPPKNRLDNIDDHSHKKICW